MDSSIKMLDKNVLCLGKLQFNHELTALKNIFKQCKPR